MNIHYIQPYSVEKNIGAAINKAIESLNCNSEDWVVNIDHDVLFLLPDTKAQIERILAETTYDILGCMTNRIRVREQLYGGYFNENADIRAHMAVARECRANGGNLVLRSREGVVAGFLLCFKRSTWKAIGGFKEGTIDFDRVFCRTAVCAGMTVGIMKGVYVFHMYRLWSTNPKNTISHLTT